jgi:two-component system sensor kinase FixL
LLSFLDELRIVTNPSFREKDIYVEWIIPPQLPRAWADPHSLMQVFLNLTKNAERALVGQRDAHIRVIAIAESKRVLITVADNGHGVSNPELLFRPFQEKATSAGMGLYLSRALMRSFGGDLRYVPSEGASFTVEIASIVDADEEIYE